MRKMDFLIAEDVDGDLALLKELIHEGLTEFQARIENVVSMDDVISRTAKKAYDIILLDFRLGEWDGIEILRALRDRGYKAPIILLTGQGDVATAVKAMKVGANDYITKDGLTSEFLAKTILDSIKFYNQQARRERAEQSLRIQSKMLQGVSEAANKLLNVLDHQISVQGALKILGEASEVNRVFAFQDQSDASEGKLIFTLKFYWSDDLEFARNDADNMSISGDCSIAEEWQQSIVEKTISQGAVADLPPPIAEVLEKNGLQSVILFPIIIEYEFWGFILFGDTRAGKVWTKDEETMFRTAVVSLEGEIKRERDSMAFRAIVEGTLALTGDDFFKSLVKNLATELPAKYAYVYELLSFSRTACRVIACWNGEKVILDKRFSILDTPCEEMASGLVSFHAEGVQDSFPNDMDLASVNAVSYAGVPFFNSSTKTIGFLAVADDKPMLDKGRTISLLRVFASRAGAELERKWGEEIIKNMAYYDSLTGLPNRLLLNDRSEEVLEYAKTNGSKFAVMFLDFDHFKPINDNHGHAMGDLMLKIMADRISNNIRKADTLARIGGDEFILLLPDLVEPENAASIAKKLNRVAKEPVNLGEKEATISFSIGVSMFPQDGDNMDVLMKKADEALYNAKRKGRDTFHLYTPLSTIELDG